MGTWISHLRIAENLLVSFPSLDKTAFTFGSLAPDSGIPNANWTEFDPPKHVSHFIDAGQDEKEIQDLVFYRKYLQPVSHSDNPSDYSFLLGYFVHLLSDRLWTCRVDQAFRVSYPDLFKDHTEVEAIDIIKDDMYGLDQLYVREHPDCLFWKVILPEPIPQSMLEFVRQESFEHQINHIRDFYAHPSSDWVLDRPFPYINEATMTHYVNETSTAAARLIRLFATLPPPEGLTSATTLLTSAETAVFTPPLGDHQL